MTKYLLVYPFVSCFAWPLASGLLYLFSGETGSFPEYWGLTFLLLMPLLLAVIINIIVRKKQSIELKVVKFFTESNLFLLILYLWIFYILVFTLSFIIQLPCFFYIYDCSILGALQFLIFTIAAHFFYIDFLLYIFSYKKFIAFADSKTLCKKENKRLGNLNDVCRK